MNRRTFVKGVAGIATVFTAGLGAFTHSLMTRSKVWTLKTNGIPCAGTRVYKPDGSEAQFVQQIIAHKQEDGLYDAQVVSITMESPGQALVVGNRLCTTLERVPLRLVIQSKERQFLKEWSWFVLTPENLSFGVGIADDVLDIPGQDIEGKSMQPTSVHEYIEASQQRVEGLLGMPDEHRRTALQALRSSDPTMYQLVKMELQYLRDSCGIAAVAAA